MLKILNGKKAKKPTRFYVTMTWDDWPEGGSYGTVVEADSHEEAESKCRDEMAASRYEEGDYDSTDDVIASYGGEWYLVDCFDLDLFIANHTGKFV